MRALRSLIIKKQHIILNTERTVFWEDAHTLIVSDLHVGKSGHFRQSGIGIPQNIYKDDLHRLLAHLLFFKAERLIITGDLTHSAANREIELFKKWRKDLSSLDVHLVKGNHDILEDSWYDDAAITVHHHSLLTNEFCFIHDMNDLDDVPNDAYTFCGHMHPGIAMKGKGKQSIKLPCYYFTKKYCVLPAFSRFTGSFLIKPKKDESAFIITDSELIATNDIQL